MLEWVNPWWFAALPVVLAAPWLVRRPRVAWPALSTVDGGLSLRLLLAWTPNLFGMVGLSLLVVALARPQQVDRERVVETEGIDILLLLDTSGSMEAEDYTLRGRSASRLEAAKEVIADFVARRPDDRIGLIVFGEEAFTQVPLTTDHSSMDLFLRHVQLGMAGKRATAIGDAVALAGKRLKDLDADTKLAILLTDGRNNAGRVPPAQAADALAALDIKVYTIGVGSSGGGGFLGLFGGGGSDLDEATLKAIARKTDGLYFRAADTAALEKVYETIDAMEKTTAEVSEFVDREELYRPWLVAGLLMLLIQQLLAQTVFRRLP